MFNFDDRVLETSITTGTSAYALLGAFSAKYTTFSDLLSDGDIIPYHASDATGWETGLGTYNSGPNTLSRTSVKRSSNANAAVNWAAGTRMIGIGIPAYVAKLLFPRTTEITYRVIRKGTILTTGNDKERIVIPVQIDGWELIDVGLHTFAASSSGIISLQVHNLTAGVDMLTVNSTLAVGKKDSSESGNTPATINSANRIVSVGDEISFDLDQAGTDADGLDVRLRWREVPA
jgi:hypothetical protein